MFTYSQIAWLCQSLQPCLIGTSLQKCFIDDSNHIFLTFKEKKQSSTLLLCFKSPFTRFHLISTQFIPKEERLFHPLFENLQGMDLLAIQATPQDRIVQFHFSSNSKQLFLICEFFFRHPNLYLTTTDFRILYSLHPVKQPTYSYPPPPRMSTESTDRILTHREIEKYYKGLESTHSFENEKKQAIKALNQSLKSLRGRKNKIDQSLDASRNWKFWQHEGDLIKANFHCIKKGLSELTVLDWHTNQLRIIQLDCQSTPEKEMSTRYKQAKKLQRGLKPLTEQLDKVRKEIEGVESQLIALNSIQTQEEWQKSKGSTISRASQNQSIKKNQKAALYHTFQSTSGMPILVGKNAKSNEWLTFHAAKGNDWWLHVQGYPGSHVIIKTRKNQPLDHETLQEGMQMALFYSQAKNQGEAEVCVTQKKYVSRLGSGKRGQVQISQHSTYWVCLDLERCKRIRQRT